MNRLREHLPQAGLIFLAMFPLPLWDIYLISNIFRRARTSKFLLPASMANELISLSTAGVISILFFALVGTGIRFNAAEVFISATFLLLTATFSAVIAALIYLVLSVLRLVLSVHKIPYRITEGLVGGILTTPSVTLALLLVMFGSVYTRIFPLPPANYYAPTALILPSICAALLPAWFSLYPVTTDQPESFDAVRIGRRFTLQAGWLLGVLALCEFIFGIPGVGRELIQSFQQSESVGVLTILPLYTMLLLVSHLRGTLFLSSLESKTAYIDTAKSNLIEEALPGYIFFALLALIGIVGLFIRPQIPGNSLLVYQPPSETFPLGTDAFGRNIMLLIFPSIAKTAGMCLVAAVVSVGFGAAWSFVLSWLDDNKYTAASSIVSGIIRSPLIIAPVLFLLPFALSYVGTPTPLAIGAAVGTFLSLRASFSNKYVSRHPINKLSLGILAAFQYILLVNMFGFGLPSHALSIGTLFVSASEFLAGVQIPGGGFFYRLAMTYTATAFSLSLIVHLAISLMLTEQDIASEIV